MTIKTRYYVLAILLAVLLSVGGIAKVSHGLHQMLGIERIPSVEIKLVGENIELYLFNHKRAVDLTQLMEFYQERVQGILTRQE